MSDTSAAVLLCLLGCHVWKAVTKTLQDERDAKEVSLKVHLSDASTHQPLSGVTVDIFANHTLVATETSIADGNVFLRFSYRLGTLLVITATKHGFVPSCTPWQPTRLPVFSSLSLDLLPERPATLMVYEDVVQVVSGYQGSRMQAWVQFQRRALTLPPNSSYTNLTALLTVTHSPDAHRLPYLKVFNTNATGFELTPVAAISVHLLGSDGSELQVTEPISVRIPLPANSGLKENDHIPAWRFDPKLGAWLKSSLGYVQKEGEDLILTYIAPQLGYWVAAMSPLNTGPEVAKDISTYHTFFLLAILGGMVLLLLLLFCLLLYYCRRKCVRSGPSHRKLAASLALEHSKRDQSTSMSHLNLLSETHLDHLELVSQGPEADLHTPILKASLYNSSTNGLATSQNELPLSRASQNNQFHRSAETFALKAVYSANPSEAEYRRSYTSVLSSSLQPLHTSVSSSSPHRLLHSSSEDKSSQQDHGRLSPLRDVSIVATTPCGTVVLERRVPDCPLSRSVDQLERDPLPLSLTLPRPGPLLCCSSELHVSQMQKGGAYHRPRPTLLIPAHYMRLPGTHPLSGQALLLQSDERSELESIQAELTASHKPLGLLVASEGSESQEGVVDEGMEGGELRGPREPKEWSQALSIPEQLSQASLGVVEMNGEDQLLAEKALLELRGGKPLPHPRAWFVSLDGRSNAHIRHSYIDLQGASGITGCSNDASLDSGVDMGEVKGPNWRRASPGVHHRDVTPQAPSVTYTQVVLLEDSNSPTDKQGIQERHEGGDPEDGLGSPLSPTPPAPSSPPCPASPAPPLAESVESNEEDFRTEPVQTPLQLSCSELSQLDTPDEPVVHDDSGDDDNKKSPWQKREERPLLAFNPK
uniref:Protein FAM171A1 n=1 Tax=Denticeps clupeoides TaxID=299321 RepID=A0AAY4AIS0_9TELE